MKNNIRRLLAILLTMMLTFGCAALRTYRTIAEEDIVVDILEEIPMEELAEDVLDEPGE